MNLKKIIIKKICYKKKKIYKKENIKNILFETSGQIGDTVINSSFLENLYKLNININIDITVQKNSMEILKYCPYIKNVYPYRKYKNKVLRYIDNLFFSIKNRKKYDLIISMDTGINIMYFLFLKILNPKYFVSIDKKMKYGIEKGELKIVDFYFSDFRNLLTFLGIENISNQYKIYLGPYEKIAENYFSKKNINIIFNYIGSKKERILEKKEVKEILKSIVFLDKKIKIFVSSIPTMYTETNEIIKSINDERVNILPKTNTIFEICSYIKYSDIVISVDTSLIHIASAYDKPILGFYTSNKKNQESASPKSSLYYIVESPFDDKIKDLPIEMICNRLKKIIRLNNK